jgi:hypothetical protein
MELFLPQPWPPQGYEAAASARTEIDSMIHELKSIRNSLSPLLKLPTELVLRIIYNLTLEDQEYSVDPSNYPVPASRPWLSITHVCRSLRNISLGNHLLWNKIDCSEFNWLDEFVRRSGEVPLELVTPQVVVGTVQKSILRSVLKYFDRARCLNLGDMNSRLIEKHLYPRLVQPAPLIQRLYLHGNAKTEPSRNPIVPYPLFGGDSPQLRLVSIANYSLHECMFVTTCTSLTVLHLYQEVFGQEAGLRPLIQVLSTLPMLKVLTLHWTNILVTSDDTPCTPPLQLSHLDHVEIFHHDPDLSKVMSLLESISPPLRTLILKLKPTLGGPTTYSRLLHYVAMFCNIFPRQRVRVKPICFTIELRDDEGGSEDEIDGDAFILAQQYENGIFSGFKLEFSDALDDASANRIISVLSKSIHITELELFSGRDVMSARQHGLLASCKRLTLDLYKTDSALLEFLSLDMPILVLKELVLRDDELDWELGALATCLTSCCPFQTLVLESNKQIDHATLLSWKGYVPQVKVEPLSRRWVASHDMVDWEQ